MIQDYIRSLWRRGVCPKPVCTHREVTEGGGMYDDLLTCDSCGLEKYPEAMPGPDFGRKVTKVEHTHPAQRKFFSIPGPSADDIVYFGGRGSGSKTRPFRMLVGEKSMRGYVVGLMFDHEMNRVVLIEKKHGPKCTVGKWNGPGGKIELEEISCEAMAREFHEETGFETLAKHWNPFCTIRGEGFFVDFFWNYTGDIDEVKTTTDEEVRVFSSGLVPSNIMENLRWMITFLQDGTIDHMQGCQINGVFKGTDAE